MSKNGVLARGRATLTYWFIVTSTVFSSDYQAPVKCTLAITKYATLWLAANWHGKALKQIYFSHRHTQTHTDREGQWNLELGLRPVGAYAYAPAGRRNKGSLRPVEVMGWRQNSWKSRRSKIRRFFGGMRNRGCFETGSLEWFNYEF